MSLVIDYTVPFRNTEDKAYLEQINGIKFYNPLGVGLEIETGGHVFHLNFYQCYSDRGNAIYTVYYQFMA